MLPDYEDIRRRIHEPPKWFTVEGVPRYDAFSPDALGVYDHYAALFLCRCQACGLEIPVGIGWDHSDDLRVYEWKKARGEPVDGGNWLLGPEPPTTNDAGWCGMGDPPRHDCEGAGETMTSDTTRILEYWTKTRWEWVRHPEHEVTIAVETEP